MFLPERMGRPHTQGADRFILRLPHLIFEREPAVDHFSGMLIAALAVIGELGGVGGA
ncbi:hypothetical protein D3C71_2029130 [compost metagenome]